MAIVDSGAQSTSVSREVAKRLGLDNLAHVVVDGCPRDRRASQAEMNCRVFRRVFEELQPWVVDVEVWAMFHDTPQLEAARLRLCHKHEHSLLHGVLRSHAFECEARGNISVVALLHIVKCDLRISNGCSAAIAGGFSGLVHWPERNSSTNSSAAKTYGGVIIYIRVQTFFARIS